MADLTRKTANLFDKDTAITVNGTTLYTTNQWRGESTGIVLKIPCETNTQYTLSIPNYTGDIWRISLCNTDSTPPPTISVNTVTSSKPSNNATTFSTQNDTEYILFQGNGALIDSIIDNLMLNTGSQPLPYEPYGWVHSLRKFESKSETIQSGDILYADGTSISNYTIKGNTTQSGTPSPSNPVPVVGVGERTENLCLATQSNAITSGNYNNYTVSDYTVYATGTTLFGFIVPVSPNTTYTCYSQSNKISVQYRIREYSSIPTTYTGDNFIAQPINQNYNNGRSATFTTSSETTYILFAFYVDSSWTPAEITNIMLIQGSTAPTSYIPYGYKIPISTVQTTNIYLGSISSTRKIKKYVFTGQEADLRIPAAITATNAIQAPTTMSDYEREPFICSHMQVTNSSSGSSTHGYYGQYLTLCFALSMGLDTLDKARTYLQQQYANGTPVTVWYVLSEPTTGIVNEPLMKIGDYADSISNAASIPTTEGANTITVDTTVQPSEVTMTWTGWHDSSVKEWDGTNWQ